MIIKNRLLGGVYFVSILLSACGTGSDGLTRVKTTDGYLNETKITLPARASNDIGHIVFIRKQATSANISTIFINEREVGSLSPERYSETLVCPGAQHIRIDTRTGLEKRGAVQSFNVAPGATSYIQISEGKDTDFVMRSLSEEEMRNLRQGLSESHIINRHQPVCQQQLKVLKQINLAADALFPFDSTEMLPAGRARVDKLVQDILSMGIKIEQIRITGYTDRLGGEAYNQRLSQNRATAVANYMKQKGLSIPTITEGKGKRDPISSGCTGAFSAQLVQCLQVDRRVSIELLGVAE